MSKHISSPTAVGSTSSGPSHSEKPQTEMATHAAEQEMLVEAMPFNKGKALEYGHDNAVRSRGRPGGESAVSVHRGRNAE